MKYFVHETQLRPDGEVNVIPAVGRSTFALTLSYYYERALAALREAREKGEITDKEE